MGSPKPLLDWHGRPLVRYQVEQLRDAGCDLVVVVLGFASGRIRCFIDESQALVVENAGYREGRASSVRAGVAALPASTAWIAVLGVDQPRPSAITRALIEASRTTDADLLIPTHNGRRGHPTLFSGRLISEMAAVQEATLGLRDVVIHHQG
jgi:CTP:molybdopterin cytidylyltransferase MocA